MRRREGKRIDRIVERRKAMIKVRKRAAGMRSSSPVMHEGQR